MTKSCSKCGSDLVGESTLSGMKIYECRSSGGALGIAQSDICKGREPLWIELLETKRKLEKYAALVSSVNAF